MDSLEFIVAVEEGYPMDDEQYIDGMAGLVRSNIIWSLQGSWQRGAQHLIDAGIISQYGETNQSALAEMGI